MTKEKVRKLETEALGLATVMDCTAPASASSTGTQQQWEESHAHMTDADFYWPYDGPDGVIEL